MFDHPEYMPGCMAPIRKGDNERLVKACAAGNISDARKELALGASANATAWLFGVPTSALSAAVRSGRAEMVGLLLKHGARACGSDDERSKPLSTGLLNLEEIDATRMTRMLLEAGAPHDDELDDGFTPLHIASMLGYAQAAEMLVALGADPDAPGGPGGVSPAELAEPDIRARIRLSRDKYVVMLESRILSEEVGGQGAVRPSRRRL